MIHLKTASFGLALLAFAGGAAFAQTNSAGSMSNGGAMSSSGQMSSKPLSKTDMATTKRCQAMSHDMMMKDAKCMKMMKMHPEMMNSPPMGQ